MDIKFEKILAEGQSAVFEPIPEGDLRVVWIVHEKPEPRKVEVVNFPIWKENGFIWESDFSFVFSCLGSYVSSILENPHTGFGLRRGIGFTCEAPFFVAPAYVKQSFLHAHTRAWPHLVGGDKRILNARKDFIIFFLR